MTPDNVQIYNSLTKFEWYNLYRALNDDNDWLYVPKEVIQKLVNDNQEMRREIFVGCSKPCQREIAQLNQRLREFLK